MGAQRRQERPRSHDNRLGVLFHQGGILTLEETYTGEVLRFLQQGRVVHYGQQVPGEKKYSFVCFANTVL